MAKKNTTIPIILCCGHNGRAVIYGRVARKPREGQAVTLIGAKMVLRWDSECGGLLGLAARGPMGNETRITHAVPSVMETVWQEWVECSPEGAEGIEAWPAA